MSTSSTPRPTASTRVPDAGTRERARGFARTDGSDLTSEASLRSSVQCQTGRPVYVTAHAWPTPGRSPPRAVSWSATSLTWRGTDELGRLRRPSPSTASPRARSASCRTGGLLVSGHGPAHRLIIALAPCATRQLTGSRPGPDGQQRAPLHQGHVRDAVRRPAVGQDHARTIKIGGGMRAIAKSRGHACVATGRLVQSGPACSRTAHVKNPLEKSWDGLMSQQWGRC